MKSIRYRRWLGLFTLSILCVGLTQPRRAQSGQDAAAPAADPSPATESDPSQPTESAAAAAEFKKQFDQWKVAIREIDALRIKYQVADEATREALEQQLHEKFESAKEIVPRVVEAAKAAYDLATETDQEIEDFLTSVLANYVFTDRYEDAMPLVDSLVAKNAKHESIPVWGGLAAVAVADYDKAKTLLSAAKASGVFERPPVGQSPIEARFLGNALGYYEILDEHRKKWEKEQAIRAAEAKADDLPRVLLKTSKGDITLELFENEAPNTVKNFISLVEKGYYNGTVFHRVLPNFMAQGGSADGEGLEGPGYAIPCECYQENARFHFRGSLSMAKKAVPPRDTGGSQFFLTFLPTAQLDGKHTVFGRVIDGMDVLAKIQRRDPENPPLPEPDELIEATVLRKRPDTNYSDFKKMEAQ